LRQPTYSSRYHEPQELAEQFAGFCKRLGETEIDIPQGKFPVSRFAMNPTR
jgi:hypothetical protein